MRPEFDASSWTLARAGFGSTGTPGARIGTEWKSSSIWLRREFSLEAALTGDVRLALHHDEDVDVWIDGVLAARCDGYTTSYGHVAISPEARTKLTPGKHVLAVSCRNTGGGQFIDVGLDEVVRPASPR